VIAPAPRGWVLFSSLWRSLCLIPAAAPFSWRLETGVSLLVLPLLRFYTVRLKKAPAEHEIDQKLKSCRDQLERLGESNQDANCYGSVLKEGLQQEKTPCFGPKMYHT
jgi:hypothetical protein